ncbi:histone chaperone asf1b-B [Patella vulgata]|uniref:histone chaperone asf1b-B n=1 Tax=Patella vulgata TaxID=6465 RepID=UPI0021809916|nr:histone chaperone asf1b-B [Patella vulgata]
MAKVNVLNVNVLDNPSPFVNPFQFEITFECIEDLPEDLEWKLIYVGSAETEEHDQVLETVFVGPVPGGRHMFVFQADPPDITKIPVDDVIGVTIILLTCCYRSKEFIRVGYYVNNEYDDPELKENPPTSVIYEKLQRNILNKPRVTKFKIDWDDNTATVATGENGENVPPVGNIENMETTSNQMCEPACAPLGGANNFQENSNSISMDTSVKAM